MTFISKGCIWAGLSVVINWWRRSLMGSLAKQVSPTKSMNQWVLFFMVLRSICVLTLSVAIFSASSGGSGSCLGSVCAALFFRSSCS